MNNPWMLLPAAAGLVAGLLLAISWERTTTWYAEHCDVHTCYDNVLAHQYCDNEQPLDDYRTVRSPVPIFGVRAHGMLPRNSG